MLQAAKQEAKPNDQEQITDNWASNWSLDQLEFTCFQCHNRDDQFGSIAKCRIQQTTNFGPVWIASSSVASPKNPANGIKAKAEKTKINISLYKKNSATTANGTNNNM